MSINKKIILAFSVTLVLALIGASAFLLSRDAQVKRVAPKVYKVGILSGFSYIAKTADGLKAGLAELGYIEGKNITYDLQAIEPDPEGYRVALQKFADEKVDVIHAFPTEAALEAKKIALATGIPLVFSHSNFEGMNLINSIKEPGNNLTGVRYPGPDVALKRLELLLEILPNTKTILIPYHKSYPNVPPQLDIVHEWAPKFGVEIVEMPVGSPEELGNQLNALAESGKKIDALMTLSEIVSANPDYAAVWGKFVEENNIPAGGTLLLKKDGYQYETLYGVDVNFFASGKQTSKLVDKVLRGTPAGTIPVESAEMFFQVNYRKATETGVVLSEGLLSTADEVIR